MKAVYEWLAAASVWWWPRFADHLWQTTAFALVILLAAFALKRGPASWRHAFCLIASAKFILPAAIFAFLAQQSGFSSFSLLRSFQESGQNALVLSGITGPVATFSSSYAVTVVATETNHQQERYLALTIIWLAGVLTMLLLWILRRRRFLLSLRLGQTSRHGREWQALERARISLQWKGEAGLVITPLKLEPAVWRVWRPVVVLPESIAGHLSDDELEAIMLHELVHIQRRDNLIGNLQWALCALLWFHPLVWFINRKLFDEREQVCDERVMKICRVPEAYASSILKVVRFCFGWRMAGVTGAAGGSNLQRRIENIMATGSQNRRTGLVSRLLAVGLLGVALLILVAAGVYSHPRAGNRVARTVGAIRTANGSSQFMSESESAINQRSSRKSPPSPPSPPTPPTPPSDSSPQQPPQPPQPSEPSEPNEPNEANEREEQAEENEQAERASEQAGQAEEQADQAAEQAEQAEQSEERDKDFHNGDKEEWKDKRDKIKKGELIEAPQPAYPNEIKRQKIEGTVVVVVTIGNDGRVIYAKAKSGPPELYGVSEAAARKARFKPTVLHGKPVKVTAVISYDFVLDNSE